MKTQMKEQVHFVDIPTTGDALCGCSVAREISWTCDPFNVTCPRCRKVLQKRVTEALMPSI